MAYEEILGFNMSSEGQLLITLRPMSILKDPPDVPITRDFFKSQIISAGYGKLYIFDNVLEQLINDYIVKNEPITKAVAEKRNAEIEITIAPDSMKAWIHVDPPYGGEEASRELISEALEREGIIYGVKPDIIQEAIVKGFLPKTIIAEGFSPVRGKDAVFECLVELPDEKGKPKIREDGSVDYHDLGIVITVDVGDPLMRKHPPTMGTPGMNILGQEIQPEAGKDKTFTEMKGTMISLEDPDLLIASMAGQPSFGANYVKIDPVFRVNDVGYATGDIKFAGTVIISGSVQAGFSVVAGGDIVVTGTVESAILDATGNIELKSGIIGQNKAKIKAKGNISAKFVENSHMESEGSIFINDMVMHSELVASDKIEVGLGGKGQIVGGICRATSLIKTKIAGSTASTNTVLEVGVNPYLQKKLTSTKKELEILKKNLEEVIKNIIHVRTTPKEGKEHLINQLERSRNTILADINELNETLQNLNEQLNMAVHAKVVATKYVYAGVKIRVSDVLRQINEDTVGCSFTLRDKEIVSGPI